MTSTVSSKHPHYDEDAIKADISDDDDDDLTGMMSVVMVYFFGNLAIRTPSPCKEATGYCPHGGCPDVITPGAPYKVTSCYLIPSSSIDEKSTYISLIFSKDSISRFYPDMANYTISHHTIPVTEDVIISDMFPTIVGTTSFNVGTVGEDNSFIVDMTGRNYFAKYKHGFHSYKNW